jgi:alkanesulfonate monooxygenase SsuD/methylene tetrahydromethanopterin reductase-like flavin-dependent oxidoreductase (luciferase family)
MGSDSGAAWRSPLGVGVGLPTRLAAARPDLILDWAREADRGPFSSLAVTDRVVIDALEPLTTLALAAGVTRRLRLLSSVVIGPTRETTLLARQAATIDTLSRGRLTLGLGVGARRDDYAATGIDFGRRGRAFDEQLGTLRAIWGGRPRDGAAVEAGPGRIGPRPHRAGGPEVLIGGYVDAVARRVATWGDGYMAPGGGDPASVAALWDRVRSSWNDAGRTGTPRFVGGSYFALGPDAELAARAYVTEAYGHDPALAERRLRGVPTTPAGVRALLERSAGMGMDEVILRPCGAGRDQLDRLADLL